MFPFRKRHQRERSTVGPSTPHAYVQGHDPGVGAVGIGGGNAWGPATPLGAMGAYTRTQGCAVPGCGKPADDLVHAPEDR